MNRFFIYLYEFFPTCLHFLFFFGIFKNYCLPYINNRLLLLILDLSSLTFTYKLKIYRIRLSNSFFYEQQQIKKRVGKEKIF